MERETEREGGRREPGGPGANNHTTLHGKVHAGGEDEAQVQQLGEAVFTYNTRALL